MPKRLSFTDQIRKALAHHPVSRYRIAQETGIAEASLSRFVNGERGLSFEALDVLAEYIGLEVRKQEGE